MGDKNQVVFCDRPARQQQAPVAVLSAHEAVRCRVTGSHDHDFRIRIEWVPIQRQLIAASDVMIGETLLAKGLDG